MGKFYTDLNTFNLESLVYNVNWSRHPGIIIRTVKRAESKENKPSQIAVSM